MLERVAVFFHPRRLNAIQEAEWLAGELKERGIEVSVASGWDDVEVRQATPGASLLVALGGDGTIIHLASLAAPHEVPVLGVNLGRVGFLAEMTPQDMHDNIDALAAGRFWVETRTLLDVEWHTGQEVERFLSLNEVALSRGLSPQAVRVNTQLDGQDFIRYTADAVLVVTATGSTAYSLAAGGPIMYPEGRDFMLTPVAPHLHIGRSIVVPGSSVVRLSVASDRAAVLSVDGWTERQVKPHQMLEVCRSEKVARFARFGECSYFYHAIAQRLE